MPPSRHPGAHLREALEKSERIYHKLKDVSLQEFEADLDLQDIGILNLYLVGEALHQYSKQEPLAFEQISDLDKIIGARHVIAHGYYQLRLEVIHRICTVYVEILIEDLRAIIPDEPLGGPL